MEDTDWSQKWDGLECRCHLVRAGDMDRRLLALERESWSELSDPGRDPRDKALTPQCILQIVRSFVEQDISTHFGGDRK